MHLCRMIRAVVGVGPLRKDARYPAVIAWVGAVEGGRAVIKSIAVRDTVMVNVHIESVLHIRRS